MAEPLAGDPFEAADRPILYDGDYTYLANAAHPGFPPMVPRWITPEEAKDLWPAKTVQNYETEIRDALSQEPSDYLTLTGIRKIQEKTNRELTRDLHGFRYKAPNIDALFTPDREWKDNSP